jgi:voltage-gated potassium channel
MATPKDERAGFTFLEIFVLVLSVYVLGALFAQAALPLAPETHLLLDRIDFAVCLVFIFEFFIRLRRAPSKWGFLKWNWIDLLASVPAFDLLRWGRLVRLVKIVRILRAFRSAKVLVGFLFSNRARGTFATVALISVVLTIFSSIAVLNFEGEEASNIRTPSDALWWSFVTVTTVGYGDKYPVTPEGRLVGVVLMTAGAALFGTFTAYVASFFLEAGQGKEKDDIQQLTGEIRQLRERLDALASRRDGSPAYPGPGLYTTPATDSPAERIRP